MTVEDLMVRLRIEEDNKAAEKRSRGNSTISRANECRGPKKDKKKDQANLAESKGEMVDLCAMLSECNLVGNPREWWIDSGASCHVCANKELFSSYTPAPTDEKLFMANSVVAKVEGTGKILLKMTSGKVETLNMVSRVFTFEGRCLVVNRMDRFMLSWQNRILVWVGRFRDSGFDVVLGWWKVFGSSTSVILLLERYREATVARGPSSSVAGIVYNYGSYFSVLVASLEVLYAWMGRSSVGYLIISICGLDKRDYSKMGARWICIRLV
ncbi:uncharacterized protein LOC125854839 [Solanum stenotomum]|uniref:uncharacterized protein LOC125854839 n=1 Tax=Solanum stenotomum TaxID=172797 RepID=UPI0020D17D4B|nr:uncharacterized protein LOC125854839 [Solanum stenotomum]